MLILEERRGKNQLEKMSMGDAVSVVTIFLAKKSVIKIDRCAGVLS